MKPSHDCKILLPRLIDISYQLSNIIVASDNTRREDYSKSYRHDKDAFRKLIAAGNKTERLLRQYFKDLSYQLVNEVDWSKYSHRLITAAEPTLPLILYRGGKNVTPASLYSQDSESFGISTSVNPTAAKAFAKAAGKGDVAELIVSPGAKIKTIDTKGEGIDRYYTYQDLQNLHAQGFDVVQDTSSTVEQEVRILNPNIIAKARIINMDETPPSISDLTDTIDWNGKRLSLQIVFHDGLYDAFGAGMNAAHSEVGIKTRLLPTDAPAIKAMRQYGLDRAKLIEESTKERIKESLITSMKNGLDVHQAAAELQNVVDDPYRAEMIARTEEVQAYSEGRQAVGDELGAQSKVWDNGQSGACVSCEDLDGEEVPWDDVFPGGDFDDVDSPPLHPNCYCGWHMVL
jgi:hypothetical protein